MKKNILLIIFLSILTLANAQRNLIVNTNINNSGCVEDIRKARDEVRFKPNSSTDNISIKPCRTNGSVSVRLRTDETILPQMNGNGNDQYVDENSLTKDSPISTSQEVGGSGGSVSVNPLGAASYSFSFSLPAAGGGVTPSLGLTYNSVARNGIVGWGWNIAGISAITRVGKDMYHDNYVGAVHVNSRNELNQYGQDRFALDGQRLMASNNYTCYGEDNMQFETEMRSNSKIISHAEACGTYPHAAWNGAQWFEVIREDGTVLEYGKENNSRLYPHANNGTLKGIMTWYLNKQTDIYGNVIEYKYTYNDYGVVVLSKILYGHNTNLSNRATNEITLLYASKNNATDNLYVNQIGSTNWSGAGIAVPERWNLTNQLLEKVTISTLGEKVHEYKLNYAFDGHTSRLKYINEKLKDGSDINAVVFDYGVPTTNDIIHTGLGFQIQSSNKDSRQSIMADLDGDGIQELILAGFKSASNSIQKRDIIVYKYNENGSQPYSSRSYLLDLKFDYLSVGDFDGDGKSDLLVTYAQKDEYEAFIIGFDDNMNIIKIGFNFLLQSTNQVYENEFTDSQSIIGDFDGDGKSDFLLFDNAKFIRGYKLSKVDNRFIYCGERGVLSGFSPLFASGLIQGNENVKIIAQDFDGDGRTELLIRDAGSGNNTKIYKLRDDNKFYEQEFNIAGVFNPIGANDQVFPGDFNGDGKMDILVDSQSEIYFKESDVLNFTVYYGDCASIGSEDLDDLYDELFDYYADVKDGRNSTGISNPRCVYYPNVGFKMTFDIKRFNGSFQTKHQLTIMYSTSNGYYTNPVTLQGGRLSPVPWQSNVNMDVGDFNGDGKTDIMVMWNDQQGPPNGSNTGFNADFYFSDGGIAPTFTHGKSYNTSGWHGKISFNTGDAKKSISNVVLGDIDNNGTTDIIYDDDNVNNSSGVVVLFPNLVSSKLLTGIRDGIGNKTTIEYAPLRFGSGADAFYTNEGGRNITDAIGVALPFRAVKKISQPDGVGGVHDITYQYSGAAMHKLGKGFLGFHKITTTDALNNTKQITTTEIDNTHFAPSSTSSETYFNTTKNSESTTQYTTAKYYAGSSGEKSRVIYSYPASSESKNYDLTTGSLLTKTTSSTTDFSTSMNVALANTSSVFDAANTLQASTSSSKTFDNTSFKINVRGTDYPLLRLTDETSTSTIGTAPVKTAYVHNEYTASNGILTRNEVWSSDNLTKKLRTQYNSRDAYGNVTGMTISLPLDASATKPLDRTTVYEYDHTGRFQTAMTNAIEQRSFNTYDPILGSLLENKGIDGLKTNYQYTANGRLTRKTFSDGTYETYTPAWETQFGARTSATTTYSTGGSSTSYFDRLGREIRSQTTAFDGSNIVTAKEYNAKGQLFKEFFPGSNAPSTNYVQHTYLQDGRLSISTDNRGLGSTTSIAYDGLTTTITHPDNTTTSTEEYAYGKTKRNTDAKGNTVTYTYDSNGEPTTMTNLSKEGETSIVTLTYHDGHRTSISDPNSGTTSYNYDGFGQLLTQTDAKGNLNTYTYNKIGQVITRKINTGTPSANCVTEPERTFTFNYNTTGAAINETSSVADSYDKHTLAYTYDTQGRLSTSSETIDNAKTFTHTYEYDNQGRPTTHTYPSGIKTQNEYNSYGYLSGFKRKDGTNDHYIYRKVAENAFGQTTQYTLGETTGNNKATTVDLAYDLYQLPTNKSATADNLKIFDYHTQFNYKNGNLTYRRHGSNVAMQENFMYDNLDRLETISKGSATAGINQLTMSYKDNGNIKSKSDISASATPWTYHPTKPHALTQIDSPFEPQRINTQIFCYNALGKIQTASETNNGITKKANHNATFAYGIDDQRTKMVYTNLLTPTENYTNYYTEDYDLTITPTQEIGRTFIYSPDGLIAVYKTETAVGSPPSGAGGLLYYCHTDHLGSVLAITNQAGTLAETHSFDAWGNRRNPADWGMVALATPPSGAGGLLGSRGYTFHEHLDQFGLINMNGRLYDPKVGRFLSPDPVLVTNASQNFNGYSYCLNNPLKYTDPTGEYVIIDDIIAAVVGGTLNLISAAMAGKIHNFGEGLGYFAAGAAGGVVTLYAGPVVGFAVTAGLNVGFDFATGNAYNTYKDPSSGVNGWTIAFSVLDGFNAVTGGQAGQFARTAVREALAQTFRAQLNAYTKALINSAVAKWAATKQFIKNIFVKSPKKQIALKAVENSEVREVVEKGAKGSSVGVEAGTAEFIETGHKISSSSNGVLSAKNAIGGRSNGAWGEVFEWGKKVDGRFIKPNISKEYISKLKSSGVTIENINDWKSIYTNALSKVGATGEINKTAIFRLDLMNEILKIW